MKQYFWFKFLMLCMVTIMFGLVSGCGGGGGGGGESTPTPPTTPTTPGSNNLPKTGQITSYAVGDDGAKKIGLAWPTTRFTNNNNGTVTDNLTGLVWLKNADCFSQRGWDIALSSANALASGACGLTDNSTAGKWRLPNRKELQSLVDRSKYSPALPAGHPFSNIRSGVYWSSSTSASTTDFAWYVNMDDGTSRMYSKYDSINYVWPVRDVQ